MTAAFREAIRAAGLEPPHVIIPGKWCRFPGAGKSPRNDAAACLLFEDRTGGFFRDFSSGIEGTWQARRDPISPTDREAHRQRIEQARLEAEAQRQTQQAGAAERAEAIWDAAETARSDHQYLTRKRIQAHATRLRKGALVVPLFDDSGRLSSLQFISEDGGKKFLVGGSTRGGRYWIGDPNNAEHVAIAEGFATAATIHEATGLPTATAFNAGNLLTVAMAIRRQYPNARIILCADDDQSEGNPGVTKATEAAQTVGGLLAVPEFGPDRPKGASDFNDLFAHRGIEAVAQAINAAREPAGDPKAVLEELRGLPRERQTNTRIKEAAEKLDLPLNEVRKLIRGVPSANQGEALTLPAIEPWSEPVEGVALLGAIAEAVDEHLHVTPAHRDMIVLWTLHAHACDSFSHSPRLGFTSPAKNCGKSTALHVVQYLVPRPVTSDNLSPAVFFRLAAAQRPTFIIDEVDAWLREDSNLPGALNGGFERNGAVLRCEGDRYEVRRFPTFTPVCLAGIQLDHKLPPATRSRTLIVHMERASASELRERFDYRKHADRLERLAKKCARWTRDHADALGRMEPDLPGNVINRDADRWRPLVAVADLAGGEWPERARRAITDEMRQTAAPDTGEILLRAIDDIIQKNPAQYDRAIATSALVEELGALDDERWANFNPNADRDDDKPIRPRQIAKILRPFGIAPGTQRIGDVTQKGYRVDALRRGIARYTSRLSVTPSHGRTVGIGDFHPSHSSGSVTDGKLGKSRCSAVCDGVTDGPRGAEDPMDWIEL